MKVLDIKPWVMHAEVAEKYLACDNRVILAGDAAHRFPPAGGFGNTYLKFNIVNLTVQCKSYNCILWRLNSRTKIDLREVTESKE